MPSLAKRRIVRRAVIVLAGCVLAYVSFGIRCWLSAHGDISPPVSQSLDNTVFAPLIAYENSRLPSHDLLWRFRVWCYRQGSYCQTDW